MLLDLSCSLFTLQYISGSIENGLNLIVLPFTGAEL